MSLGTKKGGKYQKGKVFEKYALEYLLVFKVRPQDRNECIWIFFKNAVLKEFREMIKIDENVNI